MMKTTKYADTFYNSQNPDNITAGKTVQAGSSVQVLGSQTDIYVPVQYVAFDGSVWFKHFVAAGLV
jgi:hypothetical protein